MLKKFMCFCVGHDWSDYTNVALTIPKLGVGSLLCRKCSRCGKEETKVDFSMAAPNKVIEKAAIYGSKEKASKPKLVEKTVSETKGKKDTKSTAGNKA